nr:PREDICTED: prohormone-1 isoform X1 [Megachile rotundata]
MRLVEAQDSGSVMSLRMILFLAVVLVAVIQWSTALPAADKERLLNEVDLVDDDGSIETALINYLFTKQIVKRLRNQLDIGDLQRKRSYWKQCAFNAVSCFGK